MHVYMYVCMYVYIYIYIYLLDAGGVVDVVRDGLLRDAGLHPLSFVDSKESETKNLSTAE